MYQKLQAFWFEQKHFAETTEFARFSFKDRLLVKAWDWCLEEN